MATVGRLFSPILLFCSASLCSGADSWCSSASAKVAIGDNRPGSLFGKTFVQFFEVTTTVSPGSEAVKVNAERINVNIEITTLRLWEDGDSNHHAEEETRLLRAQEVPWGTSQSRLSAHYNPLT